MGHLVGGSKRVVRLDEDGAILVEASICLLLLLGLAAGAVNFGGLFASTIDTSASARAGARAGALERSGQPSSDYEVLRSVKLAGGKSWNEISKVVVYKAVSATSGPPPECKTATVSMNGKCNVYSTAAFNMNQATLEGSPAMQGWAPSTRQPGTDYIGVWIQVVHPAAMKLMPSPEKYEDSVTMLMEPAAATWNSSKWTSGGGSDPGWNDTFWCWGGDGCHSSGGPAGAEPPPSGSGSSA